VGQCNTGVCEENQTLKRGQAQKVKSERNLKGIDPLKLNVAELGFM